MNQLQLSLETAELALVHKEAERIQQLAKAYQQRTPSGSHEGSSPESANYYDVSPGGSVKSHLGAFAILAAGVYNPSANTFFDNWWIRKAHRSPYNCPRIYDW